MANLIFGIGVPGSGKTSILRKFAAAHSYLYISIDDMKVERFGTVDDHSMDKEIWAEARSNMKSALEEGHTVVFDSTFTTVRRRDHFMGVVREAPGTIIEGLFFDIPLEHILERNSKREASGEKLVSETLIRESHQRLHAEPPSPKEGFDVLLRIDEHGAVSEIKGHGDGVLLKYLSEHTKHHEL